MRHAHVVFDNDSPLFVCYNLAQAEEVVDNEVKRLRRDLLSRFDNPGQMFLPPDQFESERKRAEEQFRTHFIHYVVVPFAPAARSSDANHSTERSRGNTDGT